MKSNKPVFRSSNDRSQKSTAGRPFEPPSLHSRRRTTDARALSRARHHGRRLVLQRRRQVRAQRHREQQHAQVSPVPPPTSNPEGDDDVFEMPRIRSIEPARPWHPPLPHAAVPITRLDPKQLTDIPPPRYPSSSFSGTSSSSMRPATRRTSGLG